MHKLNKKGFALVETLIVSVFVMTIFSLIFTNFFPMMGEYERREGYDDIDSIYKTYLLKVIFEIGEFKDHINYSTYINATTNQANNYFYNIYNSKLDIKYVNDDANNDITSIKVVVNEETCNRLMGNEHKKYCINLMQEAKVKNIYLTQYRITDLKKAIKSGKIKTITDKMTDQEKSKAMDSATKDYILTLPYYSMEENNNGYAYRIIVQYVRELNNETVKGRKELYNFSTIGVNLA